MIAMGGGIGGGGIEQNGKGKRTRGQRQQCGDCGREQVQGK